jgi:O-acetyl-ADP-ribose deacetylase (regulator of RNase III)
MAVMHDAALLMLEPLSVESMNEASAMITGTHDFTSFRGTKCSQHTPIQTIYALEVTARPYLSTLLDNHSSKYFTSTRGFGGGGGGDAEAPCYSGSIASNYSVVTVRIAAPAFLKNQVRNIVSCLLEVGKGARPASWMQDVLNMRDRHAAGYKMVSARGLCLVDVKHFGFDDFDHAIYGLKPSVAKLGSVDKYLASAPEQLPRPSTIVRLKIGDITKSSVNAIVTSSNPELLGNDNPKYWRFDGHSSVNGAIRAAAGEELALAVERLRGERGRAAAMLEEGDAVMTPGFELQAGHVIHVVAPDGMYTTPGGNDAHMQEISKGGMRRAFNSVFRIAGENKLAQVAIPAIGCGVKGWSPGLVARIAIKSMVEWQGSLPERVDFVVKDEDMARLWKAAFDESICDNSGDHEDSGSRVREMSEVMKALNGGRKKNVIGLYSIN